MLGAFFVNLIKAGHKVQADASADFIVDGKHVFEIGGKGKGRKQLGERRSSYVLADGIEVGSANKVSLWMMGFLC